MSKGRKYSLDQVREELALAGLAAGRIQPEIALLHASLVPAAEALRQGCGGAF